MLLLMVRMGVPSVLRWGEEVVRIDGRGLVVVLVLVLLGARGIVIVVVARLRPALLARVIRASSIYIIGIFRVEIVFQFLGLVEIELLI